MHKLFVLIYRVTLSDCTELSIKVQCLLKACLYKGINIETNVQKLNNFFKIKIFYIKITENKPSPYHHQATTPSEL